MQLLLDWMYVNDALLFYMFLVVVKNLVIKRVSNNKQIPATIFSCFPSTSIVYDFLRRRTENFIISARLHPA